MKLLSDKYVLIRPAERFSEPNKGGWLVSGGVYNERIVYPTQGTVIAGREPFREGDLVTFRWNAVPNAKNIGLELVNGDFFTEPEMILMVMRDGSEPFLVSPYIVGYHIPETRL